MVEQRGGGRPPRPSRSKVPVCVEVCVRPRSSRESPCLPHLQGTSSPSWDVRRVRCPRGGCLRSPPTGSPAAAREPCGPGWLAAAGASGAGLLQHILVRVGILGLGLMGGSLALALRARRPSWELFGEDIHPATVSRALDAGLISPGSAREVDLLVLAAPIPALPELLADLNEHPGVVTDLASTKARGMSWARAPCVA